MKKYVSPSGTDCDRTRPDPILSDSTRFDPSHHRNYHASPIKPTCVYHDALLHDFVWDDASVQPGSLSDCMLHETAVAWSRHLERRTLPKKPCEEIAEAFASRLRGLVATVNLDYKVENLCRELPEPVKLLRKKKGGKLKKQIDRLRVAENNSCPRRRPRRRTICTATMTTTATLTTTTTTRTTTTSFSDDGGHIYNDDDGAWGRGRRRTRRRRRRAE